MLAFKRSYTVSTLILWVLTTISVIGSIGSSRFDVRSFSILLAASVVAVFPIFWRHGILASPRMAISVAILLTLGSGTLVVLGFLDFVRTGGGGIADPQGSPLAYMIALAFGAAIGFCPWLITTLRGLPHWGDNRLLQNGSKR
jgi:hypothetical protein